MAVGSDDMKQNSTLNTLFSWNKTANKSFEFRLSLKAKPNKGDQAYFAIFITMWMEMQFSKKSDGPEIQLINWGN